MKVLTAMLFPLLAAVTLQSANVQHAANEPANPTVEIADRYLQLAFAENDEVAATAMVTEDVLFMDPTTEVWGSPASTGVRGRDAFLALQKSWGIEEISYDTTTRLVSGTHSLHAGRLSYKLEGQPLIRDVPFITMLRVREGAIVSRLDFGDYDDIALKAPVDSSELSGIAHEYLAAYEKGDLDTMGGLLSDQAVFVDVHSDDLGAGEPVQGRAGITGRIGEQRAEIRGLDFELSPFITSLHHVVFVGECELETKAHTRAQGEFLKVRFPLWIMLKVVDGEVVEHRDFAGLDDLRAGLEGADGD